MAVTMTKSEGVTILRMESDARSLCPPLCQIFKSLCYSPVCCSVSQHLRTVQRSCLSVLGTMQIMVGLLNIGLGVLLPQYSGYWYWFRNGFPYWLGALFIVFGIMCILSERFASPCLVIFNVILNLVGVAFAITAIVYYSISLGNVYMWNSCGRYDHYGRYGRYYYDSHWGTAPTLSSQQMYIKQKCMESEELFLMLGRGINTVMIVMSVLELCVVISSAVLGIKALKNNKKEPEKSSEDPDLYKPLEEEVATKPAA